MRTLIIRILWTLPLALLAGCTLPETTAPPANPPPLAPPMTAVFQETQSQWETIIPGLERRDYVPQGQPLSQIIALRIDPLYYTFRVHYRPNDPLSLAQWTETLPGALAIVNGNFFDQEGEVVGLLVADGVVYGTPFQDYGGTFAVSSGIPQIRSNIHIPYVGEPLEQALQGFPVLVLNGAQAYANNSTNRIARRTVIGQDGQGRIILMATPFVGLTLFDLSAYLARSDMELVNAFNLDGGGSTMMYLAPGERPLALNSFDPVPAVLAVYPR